ncbi:MAG: methionine biosynthesis protein MetW [Actinobacteria bacterium HGW-Actinobacteria-2]|nr:MAG: methionine biosynthesis protein MetW [Actinobacteria bacterium HGW-Actinobacteria-2]
MSLRPELALLAELIPDSARVLDLGCGSGALLEHLITARDCRGTGVEIDHDAIIEAIGRGVPVIDLDIDTELDHFADHSYDVVVLSRTIQTLRRPADVLRQMARIGDQLIVSVPNFALLRNRLRLLGGRMPMSRDLPYSWYDSPNLRFTSLVDLEELFAAVHLRVERRIVLAPSGRPARSGQALANLFGAAAVYVLRA